MRILVYPHVMEIGGSQLNAVDLAGGVRDRGHDVVVFGQPGPLVARVKELGLEFQPAPPPRRRPSVAVMRELGELVGRRRVDVTHGYEWTTALELYWGPRARMGVPAVATVMSMAVAPFLPKDLPLVVGTMQIGAHERAHGRRVEVIEPPVDLRENVAERGPVAAFRRRWELDPEALTLVCVTRLAAELKLEGVLTAVDVVATVAAEHRVQLVVVGDGPARGQVADAAGRANVAAGRRIVVLTGQLEDPRPAYGAADVCLGMGGSILRAMAFGRPALVQGERGFWELLTPDTVDRFLWTGWYGAGEGSQYGRATLERLLEPLLASARMRDELGRYARTVVEERFSLDSATERQLRVYEDAVEHASRPRAWWRPGTASAARFAGYEVRRRADRARGHESRDDFNAKPLAARATETAARSTSPRSHELEAA